MGCHRGHLGSGDEPAGRLDAAVGVRPLGNGRVLYKKYAAAHAKNGSLLANYVHKYFEDMLRHFAAMLPLLKSGATVHYIVGNSIFYGHMVPAEGYLAQQMAAVGPA